MEFWVFKHRFNFGSITKDITKNCCAKRNGAARWQHKQRNKPPFPLTHRLPNNYRHLRKEGQPGPATRPHEPLTDEPRHSAERLRGRKARREFPPALHLSRFLPVTSGAPRPDSAPRRFLSPPAAPSGQQERERRRFFSFRPGMTPRSRPGRRRRSERPAPARPGPAASAAQPALSGVPLPAPLPERLLLPFLCEGFGVGVPNAGLDLLMYLLLFPECVYEQITFGLWNQGNFHVTEKDHGNKIKTWV